jgi:hypothetical protein
MSDPINPAHYGGTLCAQIGEQLSGNSYQVLKYNWRLGKKDTATVEVGKSIWYLDRELELAYTGWRPANGPTLPSDDWFYQRYKDQNDHVQEVCINLINWNRLGDRQCLHILRVELVNLLTTLEENN